MEDDLLALFQFGICQLYPTELSKGILDDLTDGLLVDFLLLRFAVED